MTNIETGPEGHQFSFAEAFLDSLKWGEPNIGIPLDQFLQFLQNSPIENLEANKTTRKNINIVLPVSNRTRYMPDRFNTFVTDAENPETRDNQTIYSPKSYSAWITRIPNFRGYYDYTVLLDTILRGRFDHLQTELKGEEAPLIPNLIFLPISEEETPAKPDEVALQSAFIPMPRAS